jgi:hypothetical protein
MRNEMKSGPKKYRILAMITSCTLALLCTTCLDYFPLPDVSSGYLIVEARFTNDPEMNQVILSFAREVNLGGIPITGASVYVSDDLGNTGWFVESKKGFYIPESNDYYGENERKYVLHIELEDGREYRSDSCLFHDVPPIEEFYWDLGQAPSPDNSSWLNGLEFNITTADPENRAQNYLWTYEEIWEVTTPYPIHDVYIGNQEFESINNSGLCFLNDVSSEIMIKSTADQNDNLVSDHPIVFISNESSRLWRKYRITVWQFGLSDEAYFYHDKLQEISSQTGSIFDKQPFTLRGNIRKVGDTDEIVMGYFIVSGVSTSSVTLDGRDLPSGYRGTFKEYADCTYSTRTYLVNSNTNYNRFFYSILPRWDMVFVRRLWDSEMESNVIGLLAAPVECTECIGTAERPENW